MDTQTPSLTFREVFAVAPFRRLWLAQVVSIFGDFLAIYAVFSIVSFRMHGTPEQVSLILAAYFLPLAIVGPLAGVFVDRWNLKATMVTSDLVRAALAAMLPFATNVTQIYLILFGLSSVSSFFVPAQSVALRTLVPKEGLLSANGLMQQAVQVMQIVSPAIAAALLFAVGPNPCFWIDAGSFAFSAAMVYSLLIVRPAGTEAGKFSSVTSAMSAGVKFIFTHATLSLVIVSMTAGMFAIRCFSALMAVYVRDILKSGTGLFGILGSLVGVGMLLGTQSIHRFARNHSKSQLVTYGLLGTCVGIFVLAAAANIPSTVAGTLMTGFSVAFILIPATTLLQEETPHEMLGRVTSSLWAVLALAQVAGLLLAGSIANLIGIRGVYFGSAALLAVIAGAAHLRLKNAPVPVTSDS